MGYTWGYIKDAALAKLDLEEREAQVQNLLGRFPFYANEVITQVSSAIKAKDSYLEINVYEQFEYSYLENQFLLNEEAKFIQQYLPYDWDTTVDGEFTIHDLTEAQLVKWEQKLVQLKSQFSKSHTLIGDIVSKPNDFVSWSGDIALYQEIEWDTNGNVIKASEPREAHDNDFRYMGNSGITFFKVGKYQIPYCSRWFTFTKDLDNDTLLDMPHDILDCIPSYIAHQCFKIDDETKSAIFRNEYELFLSRIDDTDFKTTKTLTIRGGW